MKNLILILSIFIFGSCTTNIDGQPIGIKCVEHVKSIMPNKGNTCTYEFQNCGKNTYYYLTDTCGRWHVGDTVKL